MTIIRRLFLIPVGAVLLFGGLYMTAASALSPLRQETMTQPRVFAYRDWQSMGVQLEAGDSVTIRARGEWLYTPGEYHGPEGHARYPAPSFYPLPDQTGSYGAGRGVTGGVLIGRIGESGTPFLVGRGTTVQAAERGTLYLRINDDLLNDNEGWVEVQMRVETPEDENP